MTQLYAFVIYFPIYLDLGVICMFLLGSDIEVRKRNVALMLQLFLVFMNRYVYLDVLLVFELLNYTHVSLLLNKRLNFKQVSDNSCFNYCFLFEGKSCCL